MVRDIEEIELLLLLSRIQRKAADDLGVPLNRKVTK